MHAGTLSSTRARALRPFLSLLLAYASVTSLSGCRQKPPIPKEGDIVVWMHNPELIIKAKLGQRREHVVSDPRLDHLFYEPEYERFIGQFPIDYKPTPFPKFTEAERRDFTAEYKSKIHAVKSEHPIEFNLILDEEKAKATDASPYGGEGMDDPNQVKVIIHGFGIHPRDKKSRLNTQQFFETELIMQLNTTTQTRRDGIDCYEFYDKDNGNLCFGRSAHPSISGFYFYQSPLGSRLFIKSQETLYGGIRIEWFTDQKNINQARYIDAAIWRLLDAWNVAPADGKN